MSLRELLEERSRFPEGGGPAHARLAGIRAKVVARRRRLQVATGAATVLLAAGMAGVAGLPDRAAPPPVDRLAGFAEYAEGARVVTATTGPRSDRIIALRFVPTTLDLVGFVRCDAPGHPEPVGAELRANGVLVWSLRETAAGGGLCDRAARPEPVRSADHPGFADAGLRVGEPVTLTLTVARARDMGLDDQQRVVVRPGAEPLAGGTLGLAIGERVEFEDYRLPARPDQLAPLRVPEHGPHSVLLRSDPEDPNRALETSIRWPADVDHQVQVGAQTPGYLTVLVDGVVAGRVELWEYGQDCHAGLVLTWPGLREAGLAADPGDRVTITVRPEHHTGDWYLRLNPIAGSQYC
jgi:hypothetical protein